MTSFGPAGFPRTGVVVPQSGDYPCTFITGAVCSLPTLFNQTVQVDGVSLTQRATTNFINGSAGTVSCVDNLVTLTTDCTITGGSSAGITYSIADVSGSRSVNTAYQNTSSNPMVIQGSVGTSGSGTGNIAVAQGLTAFSLPLVGPANQATATVSGGDAGFSATIMPGYWYIVQVSGAVNGGVRHWTQITSTGSGGGGGGASLPTNAVVYGLSSSTSRAAAFADIVTLWASGSCTAGYLKFDGSCSTPGGSMTWPATPGIPVCTGTPCTAWGTTLPAPPGGTTNFFRADGTWAPPTGSGNTTSTALTTNKLPKGSGANSIIDSSVSDNGTTVSTPEPLAAGGLKNTVLLSAAGLATDSAGTHVAQTSGNICTILGGCPVTQPNFTGNLAINVLADYTAETGTGTTLFDVSGANMCSGSPCNGTLGAGSSTAPTWVGQTNIHFSGATPTQGISLPTTLNTGKTFVFAYYDTPISIIPLSGVSYNTGVLVPKISSSLGTAGINFIQQGPCGSYAPGLFQTSIWNSACTTTASNFGAGFHIKVIVLGTGGGNVDHIYIDGNESPYLAQSSTAGAQTSGNLYIGTSNVGAWANQGGDWDLYRLRVYSSQLSAADVQTITQFFRQDVQNRGVPITPIPVNNAFPLLHCIGDSQTFGVGVTTPFCSELVLTNQPSYTIANWGIPSMSLQGMTGSDQYRVGPQCPTNLGVPSVALLLGSTNDASQNGNLTAAQFGVATFQNYAGEIQTLKRAGCTVYAVTPMSRFGTDPFGNTFDADMQAVTAQIRELAVSSAGADGVIDFNAIPVLGATGSAPSGGNTWWQSGGLHTTQTGTDLEAAAVSATMNYYTGTTSGNPHNVTSTSYAMVASDRYLSYSPTAAGVVTLPSCLGPTGATYTIVNPQNAFSVTLKTFSSVQTLNGIDYSSTGLVLPQGSYTFKIGAFGPSTGGCFWTGPSPGASAGVSQILAGTNVTISPLGGTGVVTINASGGGTVNTQTAGAGGVTANHFVSPDNSAPTKYVASGSGSSGVGVALTTASSGSTFTLSDPVGTLSVCTDANGAVAGHYMTGSALTPSCAADTGQTSRTNISNAVTLAGIAQATVSGGSNVSILPDGRGTRGARIDTVSGYVASFARSLDYTAIGTSITNGTGNSNNTTSPNNTNWAGSIGYRTGGTFTNGGISGGEVADILKLSVYQVPYIPSKRAPLLSLEDGTNNANQVAVCGTLTPCLSLYSQQHQAAMAFMSIPSDNYNGTTLTLAWASTTTYLSGDVASSGGLNYIATGGAANLPANLNKTPASNAGYWAVYVPPVYQKIGAQTSTNITGAFIPDVSLSFSANPNVPQALGEISSANGASILWAVPTPAGNPIELVQRIMDGNGGTASVTVDGASPAANSTINGFAATGSLIKTFSQANSDSYALVSYPTTATGAAFVPASSSLTSNVATIVCPSTCTTVANQAVSFLNMTNLAFLNGLTLIVQSSSGTSFTVNFTHANVSSAAEATYASVIPGHALSITVSSTPTDVSITNVAVAANVVTLTATNTLTAGQSIFIHGLATATFLNGVTLTITSRTGTTIVAAGTASGQANGQWTHANYTSAADTGTASVNWIAPSWVGTYPSASAPASFESPRVMVLGVIPQSADANSTNTAAFNAQDLADVNTMIAQGAPVTFVDVRNGNGILPGVNPGTDFNDTLHPNDSGHRKMHDLAQAAMQNRENINRMLLLNNTNGGYGGIECVISTCNFGNGTQGDVSYSLSGKNGTFSGPLSGSVQICSSVVSSALTAYTQTASECVIRLTNTAARTVTLASTGPKAGQLTYIKDSAGTAGTGNITISVASSGTIDGASTLVINTNFGHANVRWVSSGVWETF